MGEWKEYKLGEIIKIVGGGTPKTSECRYWNGNIPWLSVVDFNNDRKYVYETEKHISIEGLNNSSTKILSKDDIIISARGTVGAMAMLGKDMAFNQSCYGIQPTKLVDRDYLYYLLFSSIQELKHNSHGGVFDTITRDTFDTIEILLPPLSEQKRIASILGSLDDKIDLLHRENETLEAMAETLFRKWFIEDAKDEWNRKKLKDICYYVRDKINVSDLAINKYVSTENMCNNKGGIIKNKIINNINKCTRYEDNDVLFSNIRPYFKKIWLAEGHGGCSNDVLCFRTINDEYKYFLYYMLRQDVFFDYVMAGTKGSKMPRGDKQHIMNWTYTFPNDRNIILKFNSFVYHTISKIRRNLKQEENLYTLQKLLLNKLFIK